MRAAARLGEGSLRGSARSGSGLRPSFPPRASPTPLALPPPRLGSCAQTDRTHSAPVSRFLPPPSFAARGPLRRLRPRPCGALRGRALSLHLPAADAASLHTWRGYAPPIPPRGPQAPCAGPPGHRTGLLGGSASEPPLLSGAGPRGGCPEPVQFPSLLENSLRARTAEYPHPHAHSTTHPIGVSPIQNQAIPLLLIPLKQSPLRFDRYRVKRSLTDVCALKYPQILRTFLLRPS